MDLTPPLTRSPSSPPTSLCASEGSSLDFPSPDFATQHYRLSSIYGRDLACSMAPPVDQDAPPPPLEGLGPGAWSQASLLHSTSTAATVPSMVTAEYDAFGGYPPALPHVYGTHIYASHAASEPSVSAAGSTARYSHSRSPMSSAPRADFAQGVALSNMVPSRVKEEHHPDYSCSAHYSTGRPVHGMYSTGSGSYLPHSDSYLVDSQMSAWAKSDFVPVEIESYCGGAAPGQQHGTLQDRSIRVSRPRRTPRRLTTKEEANFQCEVKGCGKLFSRSYNFKAHMETHDDKREYPFPCPVQGCSKKFVRKTDLQRHHQSVHMKERNHKCDYCGRLFARKDTLRRHMDDGCSKRFDIETLDLRSGNYENMGSTRSGAGTISQHAEVPRALPSLTPAHAMGDSESLHGIPNISRSRHDDHGAQFHLWDRRLG